MEDNGITRRIIAELHHDKYLQGLRSILSQNVRELRASLITRYRLTQGDEKQKKSRLSLVGGNLIAHGDQSVKNVFTICSQPIMLILIGDPSLAIGHVF